MTSYTISSPGLYIFILVVCIALVLRTIDMMLCIISTLSRGAECKIKYSLAGELKPTIHVIGSELIRFFRRINAYPFRHPRFCIV